MKISEAMKQLTAIKEKYGDLEIVGGYITDDTPLREIITVDRDGMSISNFDNNASKLPIGVFLSS